MERSLSRQSIFKVMPKRIPMLQKDLL